MKEIIFGGYTFHLDCYEGEWSGFVSYSSSDLEGQAIMGCQSEAELLGKLMLQIVSQ